MMWIRVPTAWQTGISVLCLVCLGVGPTPASEGKAASISLPSWFEANRVQAHSEHGLQLALRLTPEAHAKLIRGLGTDVLTRIYLNRDEGAWWPSQVGEVNPLIGGRDFAREISDAVHGQGMKVIAYHRHMSDAAMQQEHPDWVCRHPNDKPVLEPRGKSKDVYVLCLNSPYRQYIKTRLLELADRNVDAIYFDSWHMPDVCACQHCQDAFRAKTGIGMDFSAPVGSPAHMQAVEFVNRSMVSAFKDWREAIQARHPDVFFAISSSRYPMFFSPHINAALLEMSDTSKTEFHKPFGGNKNTMPRDPDFAAPNFDDQVALGWSIVRDACDGRPPLMWVPFIRSERISLYSASAAMTYGCVASMHVPVRNLDRDGEHFQRLFCSTFDLGKRVSPYLAHSRPVPWAVLHISEKARNVRCPDWQRMWFDVFSPALGGFEAIKRSHVPWALITDGQLAEKVPDATRLLVLPWPDDLDQTQRVVVEAFQKRGGTVLRLDTNAGWHLKTKKQALIEKTVRRIRDLSDSAPIQVTGPDRMHTTVYHQPDTKRYMVCLMNSWGWFRSTRVPNPGLNEGTEPPALTGVQVNLHSSLGRPRRIIEAVSGKELQIDERANCVRVLVPDFQIMACVVVER